MVKISRLVIVHQRTKKTKKLLVHITYKSTNGFYSFYSFIFQGGAHFAVGGFDWNLQFNWHSG
jgi:hypothetical protein